MNQTADTHLDACRKRFELNLGRVENLVQIFVDIDDDNAKSRDVLRAAVMLLHASLEDVFRQLLLYRLPRASREQLTRFFSDGRDPNSPRPEKMNVGDLATLRGKSIEAEIAKRVEAKLANSNFNGVDDVVGVLVLLGFNSTDLQGRMGEIGDLMSRRHLIVHRSDREEPIIGTGSNEKSSHGRPRKIDKETVRSWLNEVRTCSISSSIMSTRRVRKAVHR